MKMHDFSTSSLQKQAYFGIFLLTWPRGIARRIEIVGDGYFSRLAPITWGI